MATQLKPNQCRLCLSSCDNTCSPAKAYANLYEHLIGFSISSADIPQKICHNCKWLLEQFSNFHNQCSNTEAILRENIPKIVISSDEEGTDIEIERLAEIKEEPQDEVEPMEVQRLPAKKKKQSNSRFKTDMIFEPKFSAPVKEKANVEIPEGRYGCDFCGKHYKMKIDLTRHMRAHHMTVKPKYPCPFCGKVFNEWSTLYVHRRKFHMPERMKACDICGKKFDRDSLVADHRRSHFGKMSQ